jgi:hypothetical protein
MNTMGITNHVEVHMFSHSLKCLGLIAVLGSIQIANAQDLLDPFASPVHKQYSSGDIKPFRGEFSLSKSESKVCLSSFSLKFEGESGELQLNGQSLALDLNTITEEGSETTINGKSGYFRFNFTRKDMFDLEVKENVNDEYHKFMSLALGGKNEVLLFPNEWSLCRFTKQSKK